MGTVSQKIEKIVYLLGVTTCAGAFFILILHPIDERTSYLFR